MGLLLRAVEIKDRHRWRWVLTDRASGAPLADHPVALDPAAPQWEAFEDLHRYLRWHADLGRRAEHEAELVAQVGAWIGEQVLGEHIGRQIAAAAPTTVRVEVPEALEFLLFRPLELAHVDGVPLARRGDVSLVYDVGAPAGGGKVPAGDRLRMLAVFSLPTEATALGLRRERYALARLVRKLAARKGRAVDLEIIQYGATRELLARRMTAGGGPDILHISGHGDRGALLLEHSDGSPDLVSTAELLPLLAPARARVRLAVVSACDSAAATIAETLGWLGEEQAAAQAQAEAQAAAAADVGIARTLARRLDCAVVAMRYRVSDEFAIAFAGQLYENVLDLDLPLDRALPQAVARAAGDGASLSPPAISIATPALFGTSAAGLMLTPPPGRPSLDPDEVKMAEVPDEPERFVGRAREMAQASAALAPDSGLTGVLLHGMAGAGKTACALELAYRHADAFTTLAWWQAPTRDDDFGAALAGLATALERQLPGFTMVDKIGTLDALRGFLPRLSRLLAGTGLLLVLDNLETLLTPDGDWRDPRWAELIRALTNHNGESRVVLTSRVPPSGLDDRVLVAPVHALSRDEAVVLARELPHLRELLHADPAPFRQPAPATIVDDRATVREVLELVQGHPKLLELADAAATDREALAAHLAAARSAAGQHGATLSAFFTHGESALDADGFYDVLSTWTTSMVDVLPEDARLLFQLLCLLEDGDRYGFVVDGTWAGLWRRLERPGEPPELPGLVEVLAGAALVDPTGDGKQVSYRVHPGVAEAVRTQAPAGLRTAVDTALATWWHTVAVQARDRHGGEDTGAVVHAGLAAAPYLMRLREWDTAAYLLEQAILRDQTVATVQAALPPLRHIAETTHTPEDVGILAAALARVDPTEAEQLLRDSIDQAVAARGFRLASGLGGDLANLLRGTGRLREALDVVDRQAGHTRQAGLGPWNQLADRSWRLQILHLLGHTERVLTDVDTLRAEMDQLPDQPGPDETVRPYGVRETTLNTGVLAARDLGRWQQALDLNTEVLTSQHHRNAGPHDLANTRFNNYFPLLRLGRLEEAETLLRDCQQIYEQHQDIPRLGKVLGARATVASRRGHHTEAAGFEQTALRLGYVQPDPREIAVSHYNLATCLGRGGTNPAGRLAHRLAAALIRHLTGARHDVDRTLRALAVDLRELGDRAVLPASLAELTGQVEQVEGVRFGDLVAALAPEPGAAGQALAELIANAIAPPDA